MSTAVEEKSKAGRQARAKTRATALRRYIAVMAAVFWGLIVLAWLGYPEENRHSVMTHTFSFLGSYEPFHNPRWWWLFSLALCFWGAAMVPMVRYAEKCFAAVSAPGARVGAVLTHVGCAGLVCVGLFPEGEARLIGDVTTSHGHAAACVLLEIGLGGGILLHGFLLVRDARSGRGTPFKHRGFIAPYTLLGAVLVPFLCFLLSGSFVFPPMTPEETASTRLPGSEWYDALNSIYSFPLWENLLIGTLFAFLCWFALALPETLECSSKDEP